ncbi:hypothetical protein BH10ACT11_BH10ACT11_20550 [soil metagenome]
MTDPQVIPEQVSESIGTLWTNYAGVAPDKVETSICDDVVTCVLTGAVADFDRSMAAAKPAATVKTLGRPTLKAYKLEVVAAVVRLTGKRVAAFSSSHDAETDTATEVFTLRPAATKKSPTSEKQFAHAFWLTPLPPTEIEDEEE